MIDKPKYCRTLLKYRGRVMPLYLFLGGKWIFLKAILFAMGFLAVTGDDIEVRIIGGVILGYALGKTVAGVMSYITSRRTWSYADDLLNWERVKDHADANT